MKKKIIQIVIAAIIIILTATTTLFFIEIKERDSLIDKLEKEIEKKEDKIETSNHNIDELEYRIEYYEEMFGKYYPEDEEEEEAEPESITYNEYKAMLNKRETFVIFISQTYCSHCIDYKPKFAQAIKENNVKGYELDLLTLTKDEYEEVMSSTNIDGTPTTIFYRKGIEIEEARLVGSKTVDELTSSLKKYNYIK